MKENIICFLFGHSGYETESGYHVCSRCGMHEYYNCKAYDEDSINGDYYKHSYFFYPFYKVVSLIKRIKRSYINYKNKDDIPF